MTKNIIKNLKLIVVLISVISTGLRSEVLTTGADFMKIPTSARAAAMSDSLLALVDDIDALNINIGGLGFLNKIQIMYDHTEWVNGTGVRFESIALGAPLKSILPSKMLPGTIGITIQMLYLSPFQEFDDWGMVVNSEVKYNAFKMKTGYALTFFQNDNMSIQGGANLSFVSISPGGKVDLVKPSVDFGAVAIIKHNQASIRNIIGDSFKTALLLQNVDFYSTGVNNNLPLLIKFGFGARVYDLVNVDLDMTKYLDDLGFKGSLGLEYWLKDIVAFRIGGKIGKDQMSFFTAGVGFKYKIGKYNIAFDYALLPYEVGVAHKFVLKADVEKIEIKKIPDRTDEFYYKGIDLFLNRQYLEAINMWKKVSRKSAIYNEAQKRIEEARNIIKLEDEQKDLKKFEQIPSEDKNKNTGIEKN